MASVDQKRTEEHGGLSVARSDFASSLSRRLESIQTAIAALEEQVDSAARRDNLIRRLHALGASAKILGFAAAAECLARAEQQLRTGTMETFGDDLLVVKNQITSLPTLVLRGTYSMAPPPPLATSGRQSSPLPAAQGPWCVLVCGNAVLADTLRTAGAASSGFELVHTADPSNIRDSCAAYGPDAVVLDGTLPSLKDVLQTLKEQPETADTAVIVAQPPDANTSTLPELGTHAIVTSNLTPVALWHAVNRTRHEEYSLPPVREPLGDLDLRELLDRVTRELKRGLLESADPDSQSIVVSLGDGTEIKAALWSAVARIREIIVAKSESRVRFRSGPEGSVVVASSAGTGMRGRALADSATVDLSGRRIIVADDDPAITWVVGGTLRTAGAHVREVHDGRTALGLAHQWWPELVISDVLMPGLDGFALCREIKRDVALRDVPVILLSWKEDLLFRLRELGADADGYLKKEANTSALIDRAKELLWPRTSLEHRLQSGQEVRGRLDGITPRTLLDLACKTDRALRIALRDAASQYDIRIRERNLRAVTRNRANGSSDRGQTALSSLLGVSAGRFSIIADDQPLEAEFAESTLDAVLRTPILRARAAQRVLSGSSLATVEQLVLAPDAFSEELSLLPLSLRPIVDELLRGTTPGQLLASGATSLRGLESLLSDAARRGAIRSLVGAGSQDLLTEEILALSAALAPQSTSDPSPAPALFSFQLSPTPPPLQGTSELSGAAASATALVQDAITSKPDALSIGDVQPVISDPKISDAEDGFDWAAEASWDIDVPPEGDAAVRAERSSPFSRPKFSAEWGSEKRTSPGVGTFSSTRKTALANTPASAPDASIDETAATVRAQGTLELKPEQNVVGEAQEPPNPERSEPGNRVPATAAGKNDEQAPLESAASPQIRPMVAPPAPAVDYKTQPGGTESAGSLASEEEAIFPLLPSAAPDKRSSPRNTPVPPADKIVTPCTTLPSELAPRQEPSSPRTTAEATDTNEPTEGSVAREADSSAEPNIEAAATGKSDVVPVQTSKGEKTNSDLAAATRSLKENPRQWPVYLALTISTGVLSFFVAWPIVRAFISPAPSVSSQPSVEPEPLTTGAPEVAQSVAPLASPMADESNVAKEVSDLPSGVAVTPDKGLVVVKTGGVHSIFVDDEFVGRGPERIVTLAPGPHKVRASLNGEEHTESVNAVAGHAVQISLERPGN